MLSPFSCKFKERFNSQWADRSELVEQPDAKGDKTKWLKMQGWSASQMSYAIPSVGLLFENAVIVE